MTDESPDGRSETEAREDAEREDAEVETSELSPEDLEKVSGGVYTVKNEQSPFGP